MKLKNYEMDMTSGSLPKKMLAYALPFIATGALQLLFNTADIIVVGRFAGSQSLAAVGSTSSLINLIVNLFMGLSVGVSVLISQYYGANHEKGVHQTVHTALCVSALSGILIAAFGITAARHMLMAMDSPSDVIELATTYLRIYFAGTPALLVFNFGAAILRAVGDTRRPLFYLTISGVVNVILNLVLVIVFHMGVAGVAIATVISEIISAVMLLACLHHTTSCYRFRFHALKIHINKLKLMIKIGLPAGIQGCIFSISNVIIQSNINAFGSIVMAGNSAAQSIEGFTYISMNAISQTALAFTGQNIGAKKTNNLKTILKYSCFYVTAIGILLGGLTCLLAKPLLYIFSSDATVVQSGTVRLFYICLPYFILGLSDVLVGMMRGMGYSFIPMLISIGGICGLRIVWIYLIFPLYPVLPSIYLSYGISWLITTIIQAICLFALFRKLNQYSKNQLERNPL